VSKSGFFRRGGCNLREGSGLNGPGGWIHAEAGAEEAWDKEIRDRSERFDAGHTKGISGPEVFADLDWKN
jgi:hypothetical protein